MATAIYNNVLGIENTNPTVLNEWDGGTVIPTSEPAVVPDTSPVVGDMWFNEATDTLYTCVTDYTWTGATTQVLVVETFTPNDVGEMWFDEDANTLYVSQELSTLPLTLVVPTATTGYTFAGWFDAAEGGNEVTEIPTGLGAADFNLYAQWDMINNYIAIPRLSANDKTLKVSTEYITKGTVMNSKGYWFVLITATGVLNNPKDYVLYTQYATETEALMARDAFLASF